VPNNDVLLLKATRRDAIANVNVLGTRETSHQISMVSFIFTVRRHLIRLESAPFASLGLAKFDWVPFADIRVQRLATKQNAEFTKGW